MFYRMMERLRRFMQGRHGIDQLTIALLLCCMVFSLLLSFLHWWIFSLLYWVLLLFAFYRVLSRKHDRRNAENQAFMRFWGPVWQLLRGSKDSMVHYNEQRRQYCMFKCPHCGQKLRLPKGRGKVIVTCHNCHTEFEKKS
ncbi:MAG: hypothetical protein RR022_04240 [Angelakisella sp.]